MTSKTKIKKQKGLCSHAKAKTNARNYLISNRNVLGLSEISLLKQRLQKEKRGFIQY